MNFSKQKRRLYAFSFFSNFRITDAVWVVLLAARGYSLWQIGLAEGIFHITSLLCEVPSGAAADLLGRRLTLAASGLLGAVSGLCMAFSTDYGGVCLSMAFSALSCNMISGTLDAVVYDSLLEVHAADRYVAINAGCSQLQNLAAALGNLASFFSGVLGFTGFYLASAAIALSRTAAALGLAEPVVTEAQAARQAHPFAGLGRRSAAHARTAAHFLRTTPAAARLILADSLLALPGYLTLMYLQQRLTLLGIPTVWLGVPVLLVDGARMAGTAAGARLRPHRLTALFGACAALIAFGTGIAGAAPALPAIAGAMLAAAAEDAWFLHVQNRLNALYPSDQRATLVSVNSMVYSVLMIAASPLTGALADRSGTAGAGLLALAAGLALAAAAAGLRLLRRQPPQTQH